MFFYTKPDPKWYDNEDLLLARFREWSKQGRAMSIYEYSNGAPFLAKLLGFNYSKYNFQAEFWAELQRTHPNLIANLLGPHGWVVLQILIIQAKEKGRI